MPLTKLYGMEYLEKGLILCEQIILSRETDTEYYQSLKARNSWSKIILNI